MMKSLHLNKFQIYTGLLITGFSWVLLNLLYDSSLSTVCIIKNLSGLPCPTCGVTDSMVFILNGDLLSAIEANAIGAPLVLLVLTLFVIGIYNLVVRKLTVSELYTGYEIWIKKNPWKVYLGVALISMNWLWVLFK